jgi:hypothetical protein
MTGPSPTDDALASNCGKDPKPGSQSTCTSLQYQSFVKERPTRTPRCLQLNIVILGLTKRSAQVSARRFRVTRPGQPGILVSAPECWNRLCDAALSGRRSHLARSHVVYNLSRPLRSILTCRQPGAAVPRSIQPWLHTINTVSRKAVFSVSVVHIPQRFAFVN